MQNSTSCCKTDFSKASQQLAESLIQLMNWTGNTSAYPYKLFEPREVQYQDLLRLKLEWAHNYLKTLIPGSEQNEATQKYNVRFKNRQFFVAYEDMYWTRDHMYRDEKIQKIQSVEELKSLLAFLRNEYDLRSTYTYQATFGMRWMHLNGHLTVPPQNPWENFVGRYLVQSVKCDLPEKTDYEVEFQVEKNSQGLYLKRINPSSWFTDPIAFGNYSVNAYLNSYGTTADGGVYMIHENGGSWSTRDFATMQISELRLKKEADNTFEIKKISKYLPKDISRPDSINTCVYKGVVQ